MSHTAGRDRIFIMNMASNGAMHSRGPENNGPPSAVRTSAFTSYSAQIGDRTYLLQILQQPATGAEHGSYVLSRLPLSPTLILRLIVVNREGAQITIDDECPFLVAHLQLLTEHAEPIQERPPNPPSVISSQQLLYGSLVANCQAFIDQQGYQAYFFLFPDVSLRVRGRYRLGVSLTRLQADTSNLRMVGGSTGWLAQVATETFEVVQQSEYTAAPVTRLSAHLQQQGAWIVRQH